MKDRSIRVPPYIILVSRATLIIILEPPHCVSSLVFVPNSKIPHKNSPNFFCDLLVWWSFVRFDPRILRVAGRSSFPPSFHQLTTTKSPKTCPEFASSMRSSSSSSTGPEHGHPARTPQISSHHGHPAPHNNIPIHHPVFRLNFAIFYSDAHIHFRIPPSFPYSTTISRKHHHTNSDNLVTFCFENLSCGFCVLLCFGYLGTVQHQHHRSSSSPWTHHQQRPLHHFDTIP